MADALDHVRLAEGDLAEAGAGFDLAADAFERTSAPPDLLDEWAMAVDSLRYYGESAAFPDGTTQRSESERRQWQAAFGRITEFSIDTCSSGWRTPFDDCRDGRPPGGAEEIRLLFPCEA